MKNSVSERRILCALIKFSAMEWSLNILVKTFPFVLKKRSLKQGRGQEIPKDLLNMFLGLNRIVSRDKRMKHGYGKVLRQCR